MCSAIIGAFGRLAVVCSQRARYELDTSPPKPPEESLRHVMQKMPVSRVSPDLSVVIGILLHQVVYEAVCLLVPGDNTRCSIVASVGAAPDAKDTINDPLHCRVALGAGALDKGVHSFGV